jgi:hypothetical protein
VSVSFSSFSFFLFLSLSIFLTYFCLTVSCFTYCHYLCLIFYTYFESYVYLYPIHLKNVSDFF